MGSKRKLRNITITYLLIHARPVNCSWIVHMRLRWMYDIHIRQQGTYHKRHLHKKNRKSFHHSWWYLATFHLIDIRIKLQLQKRHTFFCYIISGHYKSIKEVDFHFSHSPCCCWVTRRRQELFLKLKRHQPLGAVIPQSSEVRSHLLVTCHLENSYLLYLYCLWLYISSKMLSISSTFITD